jgi:DNA polymerase-3 subunit delta
MSYIDVLKQVKKNQLSPVYLMYGSESYFMHDLRKEITKRAANQGEENVLVYDLEEVPIQEVVADAETYPFFSDKNIIIAVNPVFLKAKAEKLPFEHDLQALENYVQQPADYSILVLVAPYEKIDERKKISKQLKKHATVAVCNPIKEEDAADWIHSLASSFGIKIQDEALEVIQAETATDLYLLESELMKLAMYVGEGGFVSKEIAEQLISHTANSSSLRLVDAVIEQDLTKAITIFKELEKLNEEPIALIGLLAFQYRTMLRVKLLQQKGYSQFQMQKQLGVHPYVVKIAMRRERQFTYEQLADIISELTEADTKMKQSSMDKGLIFELLLYRLVQIASKK